MSRTHQIDFKLSYRYHINIRLEKNNSSLVGTDGVKYRGLDGCTSNSSNSFSSVLHMDSFI